MDFRKGIHGAFVASQGLKLDDNTFILGLMYQTLILVYWFGRYRVGFDCQGSTSLGKDQQVLVD